jgi:hypothetical protein
MTLSAEHCGRILRKNMEASAGKFKATNSDIMSMFSRTANAKGMRGSSAIPDTSEVGNHVLAGSSSVVGEHVRVWLPPRCLQILSGRARYGGL